VLHSRRRFTLRYLILLSLYWESTSNVLVLIDNELECAIIIVFKVLEPVMKVVSESFIWLHQVFLVGAPLNYLLFFSIYLLSICQLIQIFRSLLSI
jgi:hypothetical protein